MTSDEEVWLSKYADTFHNLYWKGPKREILNNARKLAGNDCFILHISAKPSEKHTYFFMNYEMAIPDADEFPNVSITIPTVLHPTGPIPLKGLGKILRFSRALHLKLCEMGSDKKFVLALFDYDLNTKDDTVLRKPALWID